MFTLRPYQLEAVEQLRNGFRSGKRKQCLQMRTGSGKTVVAAHLMQSAAEKGKRSLFMVHRRNLVEQCIDHLNECGINSTVIMAGWKKSAFDNPITVASRDTVLAQMRNGCDPPEADLMVVDEGHLATSKGYRDLVDRYVKRGGFVLLLTATPAGPNGTGLGDVCQQIVSVATSQQLIDDGFIVPTRVFAPKRIDLEGVKTVAGDYHKEQLSTRMDDKQLIGDIVEHWLEIAEERPTVAFACRRDHARHIQSMFADSGVPAAYVDGETPDDERNKIKEDMEAGRIKVVANVDVISIGTNWPFLSCCIDARPTKSIVRALQGWGRISRKLDGKDSAILLDHADNCLRLGIHPDDDFDWPLSKSQKLKKKDKGEPREREMKMCDECFTIYYGGKCPSCGVSNGKSFKVKKGKLVEVGKSLEERVPDAEQKSKKWKSLIRVGFYKGWTLKVVRAAFKSEFGYYPNEGEFAEHPGGERWPHSGMSSYEAKDMKIRDIWPDLHERRTKNESLFAKGR